MVTREDALKALSTVLDPDLHKDLVSLNMIDNLEVDGDTVSFTIVLTTPACPLKAQLENDARRAVKTMTAAKEVKINTTAKVRSSQAVDISSNKIAHVIAVGSGKGGVGKSTVAVNLALSLARHGASVGLLDADIYGPNIPRMLGVDFLPAGKEGEKLKPAEAYGMKVLSIGFLVPEGQALIWRGPMLHSAIKQFLTDFDWGELDYLVVDLPPGTGDVQLSLTQTMPISGAIVVTTPQAVSIDDAYRAVSMFEKFEVPVLGIIENMSYLQMPDGSQMPVFGEGGGEKLAARVGVPMLGKIPLDPEIGRSGDTGVPFLANANDSPASLAMEAIARMAAAELSKNDYEKQKTG